MQWKSFINTKFLCSIWRTLQHDSIVLALKAFWSITIPLNEPTKCHVPVNTNVMVTLSAEEIYRSVTQSFQGTPDTEHPQDACTKPTNRLWEGHEICLTGYKYHIVHTAFCVVSLSQSQRYTIISHGLSRCKNWPEFLTDLQHRKGVAFSWKYGEIVFTKNSWGPRDTISETSQEWRLW